MSGKSTTILRSCDFRIEVSKETDIETYLLGLIARCNPGSTYILSNKSDKEYVFTNLENPQDTITFNI